MLQSGRALMAAKGYRAFTDEHHYNVVQFCSAVLPQDASLLATMFNKLRGRRHDVVYGEAADVDIEEAKRAVANARSFLQVIEAKIKG